MTRPSFQDLVPERERVDDLFGGGRQCLAERNGRLGGTDGCIRRAG